MLGVLNGFECLWSMAMFDRASLDERGSGKLHSSDQTSWETLWPHTGGWLDGWMRSYPNSLECKH